MDLKKIVKTWLKDNGYDGLYMDQDCDCSIKDGHFMACGNPWPECAPGYQIEDTTGHYDFLIVADKPEQGET